MLTTDQRAMVADGDHVVSAMGEWLMRLQRQTDRQSGHCSTRV